MELRHVQAFVAVAEELHFGRAADRLRLSPSPVSRTVAELEREVGGPLFVRGHHSVTLTAAGTSLLPQARELLRGWSDFVATGGRSTRQAVRPTIRLGAATLASAPLVDRLLEELDLLRPGVPVDVRFASSTELLGDLVTGELDLSIMLLPAADDQVETVAFARYEFTVAMRDDDDLAGRGSLDARDLAGRRVLVSTHAVQQAAIRTVGDWLTELGCTVDLLPDADLIHIAQLVRRGRGLTLSSTHGVAAQIFAQPGLTAVPLDCPVPGIDLGLAARPGDPLWTEVRDRLTALTRDGLLSA